MKNGPMLANRLLGTVLFFTLLLLCKGLDSAASDDEEDDDHEEDNSESIVKSPVLPSTAHGPKKKAAEIKRPPLIQKSLKKEKFEEPEPREEELEKTAEESTSGPPNINSTMDVSDSTASVSTAENSISDNTTYDNTSELSESELAITADPDIDNGHKLRKRISFIQRLNANSSDAPLPIQNPTLGLGPISKPIFLAQNSKRYSHQRVTFRKNKTGLVAVDRFGRPKKKVKNNQQATTKPPPVTKPPIKSCIVCDSQRNKNCSSFNNSTLMPFAKNCSESNPWCYITKGNVTTLVWENGEVKKKNISKVDRGCTRAHNEEMCTRTKQDDQFTDFTTCVCKTDLCNSRVNLTGRPILYANGAKQFSSGKSQTFIVSVLVVVFNLLYPWYALLY